MRADAQLEKCTKFAFSPGRSHSLHFGFAGIVQLAFTWCLHSFVPRMEQQQASNPGSPTAAPSGAIDGAELARRMLLATEAASVAAGQAAKALEDLKASNEKGDRSWYKLLQKPSTFDPATREQEISLWKEWAWTFEQYLSNIDPLFSEDVKVLRDNLPLPM